MIAIAVAFGIDKAAQEISRSVDEGTDHRAESLCRIPRLVTSLVGVFTDQNLTNSAHQFRRAQAQPGDTGQDDDHRQKTFGQHRTVADKLRIRFAANLFAGRPGGNQAVKSAARTTRDGDEQKRNHRGSALGVGSNGRRDNFQRQSLATLGDRCCRRSARP